MLIQRGHGPLRRLVVISLCDFSGNWPRPFNDAGCTVIHYDLKHRDDVTRLSRSDICFDAWNALRPRGAADITIFGVLSAPPCTDFTVSGAQYWPAKDADGRTAQSLAIVDACTRLVDELNPAWWCLENPVGRLPKLRPRLGKPVYVQPHEYAGWLLDPSTDAYTKKTGLWGRFVVPEKHSVEPIRACAQGSWLMKLGGKSERTKELRSMTPMGFSRAFATAQIQNWG